MFAYLKNITPDIVMAMSHWLLAKLLSFMIDVYDGIRVIEIHTHKNSSHTLKGHQWAIGVRIKLH